MKIAHVYEDEGRRTKHSNRGIASVYLGYDPDNNAYLVKEWVTGQRYYTADLTFHPSTFPYRANPNRSLGALGQYEHLAPLITVQLERIAAPARTKSTRVRNYTRSGGLEISLIPDIDVAPEDLINFVHTFSPNPATLAEALKMADAND